MTTPRGDDGDREKTGPLEAGQDTSFHVGRAEGGDAASIDWVVRRFSPLLLAQADYRLGPRLRRLRDPEDLVSEVWAITLPRLEELGRREGRKTPVLMRFLATVLLHRVNALVKAEIAGPRGKRERGDAGTDPGDLLAGISTDSSGVVTSAVRRERDGTIAAVLTELEPEDRQIIVLRAIEQNPGATVALLLKISEKAVSMRYRRALDRLRGRLPGSIFDELSED
jgi:RNA polymerase sigma factor (sigma-70 family)